MIIIKKIIEEIEHAAIEKITKKVNEFGNKIKNGTSNADNFITMNDIENNWQQLKNETEKTYAEMVKQMIDAIDEREIVRKKKENTGTKV